MESKRIENRGKKKAPSRGKAGGASSRNGNGLPRRVIRIKGRLRQGGTMDKLTIDIPGKPQPKQRPRRSKNGSWYTPKQTRGYEKLCGAIAMVTIPHGWDRAARYHVTIEVYWPDKRTRDLDNTAKSILDGFNGIVWNDDRQVVRLTVGAHLERDNPRAVVTVECAT